MAVWIIDDWIIDDLADEEADLVARLKLKNWPYVRGGVYGSDLLSEFVTSEEWRAIRSANLQAKHPEVEFGYVESFRFVVDSWRGWWSGPAAPLHDFTLEACYGTRPPQYRSIK